MGHRLGGRETSVFLELCAPFCLWGGIHPVLVSANPPLEEFYPQGGPHLFPPSSLLTVEKNHLSPSSSGHVKTPPPPTTTLYSPLGKPLSARSSTLQHRCCCIVWSTKARISPTGSFYSLAIVSPASQPGSEHIAGPEGSTVDNLHCVHMAEQRVSEEDWHTETKQVYDSKALCVKHPGGGAAVEGVSHRKTRLPRSKAAGLFSEGGEGVRMIEIEVEIIGVEGLHLLFLLGYCTCTLHDLQGEMENNASVLYERASECGLIHGCGNGEDGKQMAMASSHQHNRRGTQDGHGPPPSH
ncbi:hypothetical protein Q8A73_012118 [Channa argus]|nr:hypothetical protein Q8A73_012118 [Channa argus]